MVGQGATTSKSKGKQLALSSEDFDAKYSSGLKEILTEPEGIYRNARIRTEAMTSVDYNDLTKGIEVNEEHSAITESQSYNSYKETEAFTYDRHSRRDGQEI